jgi:hypothetical protein
MQPYTGNCGTPSYRPGKHRLRSFASRGEESETPQMIRRKVQDRHADIHRQPTTARGGKTKNFFAPLRTAEMEVEHAPLENSPEDRENEPQQPATSKAGRPPLLVLTSSTNLMKLQKQIRDSVRGNFEFRNTRSGTRIVTKEMEDFTAIKRHLESNNLFYFTYFPKSEKLIRAVIRHLPSNTPVQDICDGLTDLGFDIISVKQMSSNHRSQPQGTPPRNLPLFLFTLSRSANSQEIFQLTALCHISIGVEA